MLEVESTGHWSLFFGIPKYGSVSAMLMQLNLPSFNTVLHNARVALCKPPKWSCMSFCRRRDDTDLLYKAPSINSVGLSGVVTQKPLMRPVAVLLSGNNLRQVVYTQCAFNAKHYKSVPVIRQRCPMTGEVTVGLASH